MSVRPQDRCRELLERLSRLVDDDLTGRDRQAVLTHLESCPCCQAMAESLQQTVQACRKAHAARLPADVRARAKARIAALLASGAPPRR